MSTRTRSRPKSKRPPRHRLTDEQKAEKIRVEIQHELAKREPDFDVQNIYEAATLPWQSRSWVYEAFQDSQFDITPSVRMELARQARNWEKNDPICRRLVSIFTQYTF